MLSALDIFKIEVRPSSSHTVGPMRIAFRFPQGTAHAGKLIKAACLELEATRPHKAPLDQVIDTMRKTGLDMNHKYKETSQGGLDVDVVER